VSNERGVVIRTNKGKALGDVCFASRCLHKRIILPGNAGAASIYVAAKRI